MAKLLKVFFRMSVEQYEMVNPGGIVISKIAVLFLNLVPYMALCIISH